MGNPREAERSRKQSLTSGAHSLAGGDLRMVTVVSKCEHKEGNRERSRHVRPSGPTCFLSVQHCSDRDLGLRMWASFGVA